MPNNNMPYDIVNDIAKLSSRVDGLETDKSDALSVSRIKKVYPRVGVKITLNVYKRYAQFPGSSIYPSGSLYVGGNTVLTRDN
jgi:hypothetical protein